MNDAAVDVDFEAPDAWVRMAQKFSAQEDGGRKRKAGGGGYKTRKKAEKKVRSTVGGRSLAETGRTKQFNFKAHPVVHKAAMDAAADEGITVSEWMETLIAKALNLEI